MSERTQIDVRQGNEVSAARIGPTPREEGNMSEQQEAQLQDDDGISYEFRLLTEADKNSIAFNDGNLSFFLTEVVEGEGTLLHAVAQFRLMTELSEAEYRAAFPVVEQYGSLEIFTAVLYHELEQTIAKIQDKLRTVGGGQW